MKNKVQIVQYLIIAGVVFAVDQGIKQAVRTHPENIAFYEIPGLFALTHCTNTGAAFSMLAGHSGMIAVFSVALLVLLFFLLMRSIRLTSLTKVVLSVLIGAGTGNLFDRIMFGGVTDYIRLIPIRFPVFNFADICITGSVVILSYFILSGRLDKHPED